MAIGENGLRKNIAIVQNLNGACVDTSFERICANPTGYNTLYQLANYKEASGYTSDSVHIRNNVKTASLPADFEPLTNIHL